jgi:predicted O-methyltransferase YrrM
MARIKRALLSLRVILAFAPRLRLLPPSVRRFYVRAWLAALRADDGGAFVGAAWPDQVAALLRFSADRECAVELGTGKAWTTVPLALGGVRRVISYDPYVWPTRGLYIELAPAEARRRIELRRATAENGAAPGDPPVDLLFIDSSHERDETVREFGAWLGSLAPDAVVAFHDYGNRDFPGVAAAVRELGLEGQAVAGMFVWRRDAQPSLTPPSLSPTAAR